MSRRQNNQLPNNLPQLQNLIKRDPESYKEEFLQQMRHFSSTLQVFQLTPTEFNESLDELIMFLAQVAKCYPDELVDYPQTLIDLLRKVIIIYRLDTAWRYIAPAFIILRNNIFPFGLLSAFNRPQCRYAAVILPSTHSFTPQRSLGASRFASTIF